MIHDRFPAPIRAADRSRFGCSAVFRFARSLMCFAVFLMAFTHSANAQASPKADDRSSGNRQESPAASILDKSPFVIVEDPDRLGELFQRLDIPDFQIIRSEKSTSEKSGKTAPDAFVKSVAIRGKAIGTIADLTIVMEIQQSKAGTAWTSIGLDGLVLRAIRSGNTPVPASVPRPGGPWQVRTETAGTHKIEIELGTEITSDRTTRRLALSIPEAASTELAIEVPEQVLFATTNARDSLQTRFDAGRNVYSITGLLTPRTRIELRWLAQSLIRNEDRIRLECRGQVSVRMDLDAVSTRQLWQIRSLTGLPSTLSFELPPDETLIDVFLDGQATRPKFEKDEKGNAVVRLDTPSLSKGPNSEPISVELVTRLTYPAKTSETQAASREFLWRAPHWMHGEIVTGIIALEMPDRWVLTADPESRFEPVDLRDLSDRLRKSTNQAAFRFSVPRAERTFRIRRRRPPLFTDVRTIGIVRRSQTEYVSDIVIQGEIDPLREYEIELDRTARPLFIGPRDVWERYEIAGESVSGDRKFRRLRLTPNRSLKPETAATLRIRYLRRADSPDAFSICLPRFVDSTGESYRTWLLPEPSIVIEPIDPAQTIRRKLPPQEIAVFTNLLEQSVGDDDKWIKPRNAGDLDGAFFRLTSPGEKDTSFRTLVRPASLDCIQKLALRPTREAIGIRHVFECSIDKGTFDRIVVNPSKENPIRNLRYSLSHEGADQSGNLIIQDGGFEIPLSNDVSRRFNLTLETVLAWPDRPESAVPKVDSAFPETPFVASKFDFSIADANLLQRQFSIEDTDESVSELEERQQGWVSGSSATHTAAGTIRTWTAANAASAWPSIRTLPLAAPARPANDSPIREIHAMTKIEPDQRLNVAYRLAPSVRRLQLGRIRGLSIESASFDGTPVSVVANGEFWTVPIPAAPALGNLIVKYRFDDPGSNARIPVPPKIAGPIRIPTRLHVLHSPMERLFPPWRSGWHFAAGSPIPDFEDLGFDRAAATAPGVRYVTDDPGLALPIRRIPLILLILGTIIVSSAGVAFANLILTGMRSEIPAVALVMVAALVASGMTGPIWAAGTTLGILLGTIAFRFGSVKSGNSNPPRMQSSISKVAGSKTGVSSQSASSPAKVVSKEPSTVLKRTGSQEMNRLEPAASDSDAEIERTPSGEPSRWSLVLEAGTSPSSSRGSTGKHDAPEGRS